MRKGMIYRSFIYFLSISFLLLVNGFPGMVADAKERDLPIGEMISRGEVKFEARENVWKASEPCHFPIFQGTRIKTGKGNAILTLSDNTQIEAGPNSLFSFDQIDRFLLSQGRIEFRIPSPSEIIFKAGNLHIIKSRSPRISKDKDLSTVPAKNGETVGSITIHSNGSVTVKSTQGTLSILDQDCVELAVLSSKDSVTIPSTKAGTKPKGMVDQVGGPDTAAKTVEFLGISTWDWVGIIAGGAAIGGIVWGVSEAREKERRPVCP